MDGLECSEVLVSQLERTNRLDSEFYKKECLRIGTVLYKASATPVTDYVCVSDGNHSSISDHFSETGIPYYRGQDIHHMFIENADPVCITRQAFEAPSMHRSYLRRGDVLVSIVGTIGKSALVTSTSEAACSCKLAILRSKNSGLLPEVFAIYLKTKYGQSQIQRLKRGAVQMGLLLEDFDQILVPQFSAEFQNNIKKETEEAERLMRLSASLYKQADACLTCELKANTLPDNGNIAVKSFSSSFMRSGRLDPEYYQPKYDDFYKLVDNYGYTTPRNEFEFVKTKYTRRLPQYPYIEIGDIDVSTGDVAYNIVPTDELPANANIMTASGDLLVSTVRPNRGAVAVLKENGLLVSNAFTVLREKSGYPVYTLQVLFRTDMYKDWLLKFNVGTSYPVIKADDILDIPIPDFGQEIHEKMKEYIIRSQSALHEAQAILTDAVRKVEAVVE